MAKEKLDRETRKKIRDAQKMIDEVAKDDGNEAETRRRVERIFATILGYDVFEHVTRELAVRGSGETEHCDFAIRLEEGDGAKPIIMIELKRININLAPKHLKQISSYAINAGCDWIVLTNGKDWRLYHVSFGKPPQTKLIESWDLLEDDPVILAKKFAHISYKNVKKGKLADLWEKRNVLTPQNMLGIILGEDSIRLIRRELRKSTGVLVTPEEIVGSIRRLLNEAAGIDMDSLKISLPEKRRRRRKKAAATIEIETDHGDKQPVVPIETTPALEESKSDPETTSSP